MADMRSKLNDVYSLEGLSRKNTLIHRLHPLSKMLVTIVYIMCVIAHGRYNLSAMAPFLFYPIVIMALAEIPFWMIAKRTSIAIPFTLFAGISNLIFDTAQWGTIGNVVISTGMISFFTLIVRTFLCVSAILILVATTHFTDITRQLMRAHIPVIIVSLLEMIYRYLSVLVEEASVMITSYRLRNPNYKWPLIRDMGPFVGHLFLRSIDRAERIYQAMKCRGYGSVKAVYIKRKMKAGDIIYLFTGCISSIIFALI